MEAGQLLHNNPVGAPCPPLAHAIMQDLRGEIARVYWNVNQKQWASASDAPHPWSWDKDAPLSHDTGIPGVVWNAYYNWGGSPEDPDWDQSKADAPNFAFEGVEIRWYKRFGRSMNCNVVWPAEKWNRWYERCLQTLRAYEDANSRAPHGDPTPPPDPSGIVSTDPDEADLRHVALMEQVRTLEAQINMIACVCIDVADGKKPRAEKKDWRWCHALDWVTRLGKHALKAPGKLKLHDDEHA